MAEVPGTAAAGDDKAPAADAGVDRVEQVAPNHEAVREALAEDPHAAPRAALARAQRQAAEQGLRPGSRPARRTVRPTDSVRSSAKARNRDPELLGTNMRHLLDDRGWNVDVSAGAVMGRWNELVGPTVADHAQPVTFEEGVLTVRTTSTAWATQLTLMASSVLASIARGVGEGVVTELKVVGPAAPSWVRGPRRVKGRGPRDTYG